MRAVTNDASGGRAGQRAAAAGFTLIEVMVAMVILAIGMLAVAAAQIRALQFASESDNRAQAMYLADEQMARFMAMPTNDLSLAIAGPTDDGANPIVMSSVTVDTTAAGMTGTDTDMSSQASDLTPFFRRWTIAQNQPRAGLRTITVMVRWTDNNWDPGSARQVQLMGVK